MTRRGEWYLCSVLVLAAVGSFFVSRAPAQADGLLHIYFLDVGQGDSIFVQAPDGTQILIDGGPGKRVLDEIGEIMPITDKTIDAIIATHTDADHISGLVSVLNGYDVAHIFETGMECHTAICGEWEKSAEQEQAERNFVSRGYRIVIGDLTLEVLNPASSIRDQTMSKTNNGGIVLRLSYQHQSVLLTADIEKMVEDRLVRENSSIDIDFLKIAHHGSKTSTSQSFLDATTPTVAFIQVGGRNTYGHPSSQVIDRLDKISGLRYYRNDINGRIELTLDGLNYDIKTEQPSN